MIKPKKTNIFYQESASNHRVPCDLQSVHRFSSPKYVWTEGGGRRSADDYNCRFRKREQDNLQCHYIHDSPIGRPI